jgi:hypothetical protein
MRVTAFGEFRDLVQPWQDRASVRELDERLAFL